MAVFRKTKNDTIYYSTTEGVPDQKKIDALDKIKLDLPEGVYEITRDKYYAEAQDGEPQKTNIDLLQTVTKTYEVLSPMARESMDARQAVAVAVLNEKPDALTAEDLAETNDKKKYADALDKHISVVRVAANASWANLRGWCDAVGEDGKKTGKILVPNNVASALDAKVAAVKEEAARKKAISDANKAKAKAEAEKK